MTDTFKVRTPLILRVWILNILLAAASPVLLFEIDVWLKISMMLIFTGYGIRLANKWWHQSVALDFDRFTNSWSVFILNNGWATIQSVHPIYVSDHLIWLNFYMKDRSLITVFVGKDSMSAAEFLHLRRCVICPAALTSCSA